MLLAGACRQLQPSLRATPLPCFLSCPSFSALLPFSHVLRPALGVVIAFGWAALPNPPESADVSSPAAVGFTPLCSQRYIAHRAARLRLSGKTTLLFVLLARSVQHDAYSNAV